MKILEKMKFKIAHMYDKNPSYCWANLAMWAMGYRSFWSLFFKGHDEHDYDEQVCRHKNEATPYGYCGKCEILKRY